jgi:DNA-binding transcriptional LysR family regulator
LALVRPPVPIGLLHSRFLAEELLGAVMREDHLMAAAPKVSIDELLAAPFITVRSRSGIPAVASLSATMKRRDLTPRNIVAEADSITSMFLLVESGLGIGLARQAVFRRANVPGLVIRTIAPPLPGIPLHLAWRKDPVSPSVGSLMELIVQCRTQLGSGYRIADDI